MYYTMQYSTCQPSEQASKQHNLYQTTTCSYSSQERLLSPTTRHQKPTQKISAALHTSGIDTHITNHCLVCSVNRANQVYTQTAILLHLSLFPSPSLSTLVYKIGKWTTLFQIAFTQVSSLPHKQLPVCLPTGQLMCDHRLSWCKQVNQQLQISHPNCYDIETAKPPKKPQRGKQF